MINRADYWKSLDKKYCDFCKCWIADNKPSIQFHENGRRHKNNVQKRISQISRQSAKDHKEAAKLDMEMKKMENAAIKAYMKDVVANPDYSSYHLQSRGHDIAALSASYDNPALRFGRPNVFQIPQAQQPQTSGKKKDKKMKKVKVVKEKKKIWYETMAATGHLYYWNSETNESTWDQPEEYISLDDQKCVAEQHLIRQEGDILRLEEEKALKMQKILEDEEERRSWRMREAMKYIVRPMDSDEEPEETPKYVMPGPILGPDPKVEPYGKWTVVKHVEIKQPDLQLPKTEFVPIHVPQVVESKVKIKEKQIGSLDDEEGPSSFKKRKPNPGRTNIRQRADDDE